ncbi:lipid A biosynthesis lauroyl acyltransferase [Vibrio sp. UCD-FRSSP16_10]|uniref:LpxL/LpxP family Kdo(2)-lipid IV(A) lauroyl/palmitoleoyl acyltransferase n=1 Tax=unclassified Vibrio TaxID=2614977 RepID=UPI0007FD21F8|nr:MULTISPECIES: LpxL/LpxP family Kdo(2)-lipid IV(A) lauroyl/palmitoleoyl acyltransferase [unclassified Vibrio]OBT13001.1 lipid A biosynthesis lauroyl acyltransferase [Vibrio sp. UCD-FRSSP16_30]OBT19244.1 lipid A biosynthesis lauroyl acyltransferase [Vibrio sp. UCD-FRSSP16_10]
MSKYDNPTFSARLMHPKYWGVWLGFGLLAALVNILPFRILLFIGRGLGRMAMPFAKSRVRVAKRNLELAFPEMPQDEIERIVIENFKNTGFALFETGITWFWPTWRLKRHIKVHNAQPIMDYAKQKKGVLVCHPHALNLEVSARAFAVLGYPGHGVYRPHSNAAYNLIQYWGRTHNGNKVIDRKNLKEMIRTLKSGERLFYLGDHDYGRKKAVFVPFFAVQEACTVTGANILAKMTDCAIIPMTGYRDTDSKWELYFDDPIHEHFPKDDTEAGAAYMNRALEKTILRKMDQWMWLHKRFKTPKDQSLPKGYLYK